MRAFSLFIFSFLMASSAHASYFQVDCSNADGTVRTSWGHSRDKTVFTELTPTEYDTPSKKEVTIGNYDLKVDYNYTCTLGVAKIEDCTTEWGGMIADGESVFYLVTTISKTDGSLFPSNTAGVSNDRKSVHSQLICNGIAF